MTDSGFPFDYLGDPRIAAHALDPAPAWLWSVEATRVLWANPTGASIFGTTSPGAVAARRFDARHASAGQIARLAGTLVQGATPRLERLRGFGASVGGTLMCQCSRITLSDNRAAILVVSTERTGKDLAFAERAHRLLADMQLPAAIFTADGELIEAQPAARERFGDHRNLIALGADKLAGEATLNSAAEGNTRAGYVNMIKLGAGPTFALLVVFSTSATNAEAPARVTALAQDHANAEKRLQDSPHLPLRFVWQTDAETRFTFASQEFAKLLGPKTAAVLGHPWAEIGQVLGLDPGGQIANALAAQETFSGAAISWPVDGAKEPLAIEISGLPVFDRERQFSGFRGFGICRNTSRLKEIMEHIKPAPPSPVTPELASKILPFPSASPPTEPTLTARERNAFHELAHELNKRLKRPSARAEAAMSDDFGAEPPAPIAQPAREPPKVASSVQETRQILDRLPVGILVYRLNTLIYANAAFLDWTGYPTLDALNEAGGLDGLFIESRNEPATKHIRNGTKSLTVTTISGDQKPVEGQLFSTVWNNENALVLMISPQSESGARPADDSLRRENHELKAILDTATDGVLLLDRAGRVLSANRSAEALFGYEATDFARLSIDDLFVPESRSAIVGYLDRLARGAGAGILDAGFEAIGRVRQGGLVPLYITMGRVEDGEKLCAVLRDITAWKRTEEELTIARQAAEKASIAKSEFLAKISHEIRTPLNAIIGFSEVMMDERFGQVGNERYRQYLKDIHASGGHLISLLTDLLDLSKIEAGKLDLTFASVNLNDLLQQCVAIMQQQANRERVIIRTSLPEGLPQIVADARSMRQIALNLLSNSIKFTGAGGQVIVSTALTDDQEVVLRVRDTGTGMNEKELQTALEPFRQVAAAARWGSSGTGLGLPITKALAEANHARFRIVSQINDGTLVEVAFPATRILAQ